jgi:hypothetical protein
LNTQVTTTDGTPERINIGGILSYDDLIFNKNLSSLGTSTNTIAHFQTIEASSITGSFTGSFSGTASVAISSSFSTTASYASNSAFLDNKDAAYFINTGSTNVSQSITGSLTITQNLTVLGSSSFVYVTASQVLVDQNTLTVYANGLALPTAGYIVADTSSNYSSSAFLYNIVDEKWSLDRPLSASLEGTASWAQKALAVDKQAYLKDATPSSSGIIPFGETSNTASQTSDVVLGGDRNITGEAGGVGSSYATIVNGQTNIITGANFATVIGGDINTITSGSNYSLINGTNNTIIDSSYSTVLGNTNTISGSGASNLGSAILGGGGNQILDSISSLAFGNSTLISSSDWATAIGRNVTVQGKDYAHVIGYNLTASYENTLHVNNLFVSGTIYAQQQAYIKGASPSSSGIIPSGTTTNTASIATDVILGGSNNKSIPSGIFSTEHSFIGNGTGQTIAGTSYSTIAGGSDNSIISGSSYSFAVGRQNTINNSSYSNTFGYLNTISGSGGNNFNNSILGGESNSIRGSRGSVVFGELSIISSSRWSGILGRNNEVRGRDNAYVIGNSLTASFDNTLHVNNLYVSGTIYGYAPGGGATVTISGSAPSGSVNSGSLWWNNNDGNLYIQVTSPTGSTYVPATNTVAGGNYGATLTYVATGSTWNINHNLNTRTPLITVYSGSSVMIPDSITSVDANNTTVTFSGSVAGTAILSTGVGGPTSASFALSSAFAITASYALNGGGSGGATVTISGSIPSGSQPSGSLWWNDNDGDLYIQVTGPTGSTYVPATSNAITSVSSSYSLSSSFALSASRAISSSFALTSSFNISSSFATSASRAVSSLSASFATTASSLNTPALTYIYSVAGNGITIPNASVTRLTFWNSPSTNLSGSEFDPVSGFFTATKTALYTVTVGLAYQPAALPVGTEVNVSVYINGGEFATVSSFAESNANVYRTTGYLTTMFTLNSGDVMDIRSFQNSGAGMTTFSKGSYLTIQQMPYKLT